MQKIIRTSCILLSLVAGVAFGQVDDYRKIEYPELPDFKIQKPETFKLPNGMQVFLLEDRELPLIRVQGMIGTGSFFETRSQTGLTSLFGQVQREGGTSRQSGDEIDDFLEARAASVETSIGQEMGTISMNCLTEDFDEVFAVFNDVLRNPIFAEDKLELARVAAKSAISRRNDDADQIGAREFPRRVYGLNSPLSRMPEYETVGAITRDDLLAWHKRFYHPNNILIGVIGDFDTAEMSQKIQDAYRDWSRGNNAGVAIAGVDMQNPGGLYLIPRSDVTQAFIRMGHLGIKMKDPDYYAVQVLNSVMSGGFASRFFSNIRSTKGLAYRVGGNVGSSYRRPGLFSAVMSTKSETMAESVQALKDEIAGLITSPPTDEEIRRAKESILNSFVFNYDSRGKILNQQMTYAFYGFPSSYLENYPDQIEAVTRQAVADAAKRVLRPDALSILVVGNPADFDRPLSSFGEVNEIDITIPAPPATGPKVEKTAAAADGGRAIVNRFASRMSPGALRSFAMDFDVVLSINGQKLPLGQGVQYASPDRLRQSLRTPMGDQTVIVSGEQGVMVAGGQKQPAPPTAITEARASLDRDLLILAAAAGTDAMTAFAAGKDAELGCDKVVVTLNETESNLCIDAEGSVLTQVYQGNHPLQGNPGTIEVRYSDYGESFGAWLPKTRVMNFDGAELATITLKSASVNDKIDDATFSLD